MIVSSLATVVMLIVALVPQVDLVDDDVHEQLGSRAALLDTLVDAAAVGEAIAGGIIFEIHSLY